MVVQLRRLGPSSQINALQCPEEGYQKWTVGRSPDCDISTLSKFTSRNHCSIIYREKHFYICDHGSANGTFINNVKIEPQKEYPLVLNSTIGVGVHPLYKDDSDCIVYIFELSKEEEQKEREITHKRSDDINQEVSGHISHTYIKKSDSSDEQVSDGSVSADLDTCSEVNYGTKISTTYKLKTEEMDISEELPLSPVRLSPSNQSPNEKCGSVMNEMVQIEDLEDTVVIKQEARGDTCHYEFQKCDVKDEVDMFDPEGLCDDELLVAFEASTQNDEVLSRNSQVSYSMTEELIEISDSEEELTTFDQDKTEGKNADFSIVKNEEDDDDDVIFLDRIIKNNTENYPSVLDIAIEDEENFTETDKKWIGKLFKTKEECDFFIHNEKEKREEISDEENDNGWVTLVSRYADEIGQIMLSEGSRKFCEQGIAKNMEIEQGKEINTKERCLGMGGLHRSGTEVANDFSTIVGVLTLSPVRQVPLDSSENKAECNEKNQPSSDLPVVNLKKFKFSDHFLDDRADEDAFKPVTKKQKLDPSVTKKDLRSPKENRQNRVVKCINAFDHLRKRRGSKKKRKSKTKLSLPPSETEKIKEQRKLRLKELTMRDAEKQDKNESHPKVLAPLKIKITRKNRNEFLCQEICNGTETGRSVTDSSGEEATKKTNSSVNNVEHKTKDAIGNEFPAINNINSSNSDSIPQTDNISLVKANVPDKETCEQVDSDLARITVITSQETTGLKSCLKKFGYTFMRRRPMVPNNTVRFKTTHDIRYYETENRISKKTTTQFFPGQNSVEDRTNRFAGVLYDICNWNAMWIEECKKAQPWELPPVFRSDKLRKVKKKFINHDEYMKSFLPLLLLELWHVVCDECRTSSTTCRIPAYVMFYSDDEHGCSDMLGLVKCKCAFNSVNASALREGDLVVIQFSESCKKDSLARGSNKKLVYRIFGYVKKITVENTRDVLLTEKCASAAQTMNLKIVVKGRDELHTYIGSEALITKVHHIGNQLTLCQGVCMLYKSPLCQVILSPNRPDMSFSTPLKKEELVFCGPLDTRQEELVLRLVSSCINRDNCLLQIQGGPGTGKTHVMVAFILQLLLTKQWKDDEPPKVLYCSHSDVVVDELALKLKSYRQTLSQDSRYKLVRYGNLSSMKPSVQDISSHHLALQCEHKTYIARQVKIMDWKIINLARHLEESTTLEKDDVEDKSAELHEFVRKREAIKNYKLILTPEQKPSTTTEDTVLENADIICTTCTSSGSAQMSKVFHKIKLKAPNQKIICIIDEAMQSKECEAIVPLQLGVTHLILTGDPHQLRSPVINEIVQSYGINQSLFWRISSIFNKTNNSSPVFTLKNQYRMNRQILSFPNKIFYQNNLKDCFETKTELKIEEYLVLIDNGAPSSAVDECDLRLQDLVGKVICEIREILNEANENYNIGIITCRVDQADSLEATLNTRYNKNLMSKIEVNSIENMQGREFDIVIFLFDVNMTSSFRANVALTRGKFSLIIMTSHPYYKSNKLLCKLGEEAESCGSFFYVSPDIDGEILRKMITKYSG